MGSFLEKPITEKETETGDGPAFHYAVSAMQGWRVEMEVSKFRLFVKFFLRFWALSWFMTLLSQTPSLVSSYSGLPLTLSGFPLRAS